MKFILRLLLILCIGLAGIYATSPLWFSSVLARQLPEGWQLETLDAGYPGLSGINLNSLRVKGGVGTAVLTVSAADIRFTYRDLKTDVDSISLDACIQTTEDKPGDAFTLDDLSLPVLKLTGKMPEISITQLRMTLHYTTGVNCAETESTRPLVLNLEGFTLSPRPDNSFQLATNMGFEEFPEAAGRIEIGVTPDMFKAEIQFPAVTDSPKWLTVDIEQKHQAAATVTNLLAVFDAESANREWLDSILLLGSGGLLKHADGKLEMRAGFAGMNLQQLERLSLSSDSLQLVSDSGILNLQAELQVSREDQNIIVELPTPANMQYQDQDGSIDELLRSSVPELRRAPRSGTHIVSEIGTGGRFVIQPDAGPSVSFDGDINFSFSSSGELLKLHADNIQVSMGEFPKAESVTAVGIIKLEWEENTAFAYTAGELELNADKLSMAADIDVRDGGLVSTGNTVLTNPRIASLSASAAEVDISWREFDVLGMAGNLSTQTRQFTTEFDGETWTGFDLDVTYDLLGDASVRGAGGVKFEKGLRLPIEFSGNAKTDHWNISLPTTRVKMGELVTLLKVAHIGLPKGVKLKAGHLDLQTDVIVADGITAKMTIAGYDMGASLLESSASTTNFSLTSTYDDDLSASGPVSIDTISLAGGIDITHVKADLEIENIETIGLHNLSAEVFGGRIDLGSLRFLKTGIEDTTVELSDIDLGLLLAFADIGGLEGTGLLEVSLPAGSDETGIHIKDGIFHSNGPGRLAYGNPEMAAGNIGLQALENFQYTDLSGVINYQSNGDYQVKVRLEGKNPDLYSGYPIIFNLTISGSLPELFEALFLTGSFEEAVLKEIRNR